MRLFPFGSIFVISNPNGTPSGSYGIGAGPTNLYFAGKRLGSIDRLGSNGNFYPYGEEYATTQQNMFKFTTYYRDATTLDYAKNRYYSSTMGRFMTPDPYRNSAGSGDPGSWNRYAYVGGDPVNRYDPLGLDWWDPNSNTLYGDVDPLDMYLFERNGTTLLMPSGWLGRWWWGRRDRKPRRCE
jgi:RHS repeat-associated protein